MEEKEYLQKIHDIEKEIELGGVNEILVDASLRHTMVLSVLAIRFEKDKRRSFIVNHSELFQTAVLATLCNLEDIFDSSNPGS